MGVAEGLTGTIDSSDPRMPLQIKHGDILLEPADLLICSANIYLNLSGGVGGEILRRHGDAMQRALHGQLAARGAKFVEPGEVIETAGCGTRFQHVLHAVAVDGWYHSSADLITRVLRKSFRRSNELGTRKIAVVALATGFGRLPMSEFARGLADALDEGFSRMESIVVVVQKEEDANEIRDALEKHRKA